MQWTILLKSRTPVKIQRREIQFQTKQKTIQSQTETWMLWMIRPRIKSWRQLRTEYQTQKRIQSSIRLLISQRTIQLRIQLKMQRQVFQMLNKSVELLAPLKILLQPQNRPLSKSPVLLPHHHPLHLHHREVWSRLQSPRLMLQRILLSSTLAPEQSRPMSILPGMDSLRYLDMSIRKPSLSTYMLGG